LNIGETEIRNGTISDFLTAITNLRQSLVNEKVVEVRNDNLYIRYIAVK